MLNKVMLIGHLGKDPEFKQVGTDGKVANFTLATSESYTGKDGKRVENTEWHNIVVWGGLAENVSKYTAKGSKVYVEGKIKTRSWEKDGVKKYTTEIVADTVTFMDKKEGGSSAPAAATANTSAAPAKTTAASAPATASANQQDSDDELPF